MRPYLRRGLTVCLGTTNTCYRRSHSGHEIQGKFLVCSQKPLTRSLNNFNSHYDNGLSTAGVRVMEVRARAQGIHHRKFWIRTTIPPPPVLLDHFNPSHLDINSFENADCDIGTRQTIMITFLSTSYSQRRPIVFELWVSLRNHATHNLAQLGR